MMPIGDDLSQRKKQILKALIDAHIEMGEPIGSKYLTSATDIGVSSATLRNEMAELEELGYLEHPHTSSGRVPTTLGYRFYVDELMNEYALTSRDLSMINKLQQIKLSEIDRILQTASRITASMTNYTGVAVKPHPKMQVVTCYKTVFLDKRNFVLSFIMADNSVNSKYVNVPYDINEGVLNQLCGVLNNNIANKTTDMITLPTIIKMQSEMGQYDDMINAVIKCVYEAIGDTGVDNIHIDGMEHMLQYPEYADTAKLRELLALFEKKEDLVELVENASADEVSVFIGGEEETPIVSNSSIIVKPLKRNGSVIGAIGVIGPNRMEYSKAVAVVNYIADSINRLLQSDTPIENDVTNDTEEKEKKDDDG